MISCPFKVYADFECLLKNVGNAKHSNIGINNDCFSYTAKYQDHIPCSFAYKLVCIDDKFSKDVVLYRGKMLFLNLFKVFLMNILIVNL